MKMIKYLLFLAVGAMGLTGASKAPEKAKEAELATPSYAAFNWEAHQSDQDFGGELLGVYSAGTAIPVSVSEDMDRFGSGLILVPYGFSDFTRITYVINVTGSNAADRAVEMMNEISKGNSTKYCFYHHGGYAPENYWAEMGAGIPDYSNLGTTTLMLQYTREAFQSPTIFASHNEALMKDFEIGVYIKRNANAPTFILQDGASVSMANDINNPLTTEKILAKVKAYDVVDGYINYTEVANTFRGKEIVVGNFYIKLSATNSGNRTSTLQINITGVSYACTIYQKNGGSNQVISTTHMPLQIEYLKSRLEAKDYDGNDISHKIVKGSVDTFTGNSKNVGNYQVSFEVADRGTTSVYLYDISVVSEVSPWFVIENSIYTLSTNMLSVTDFARAAINANRMTESYTSLQPIINEYTNNYNVEGTYNYSLLATYASSADPIVIDFVVNVIDAEPAKEWYETYMMHLIAGGGAVILMLIGFIAYKHKKSKE